MKRYHGGPITPDSAAIEAWSSRFAMISFAHPRQDTLAFELACGVALDNGAFSMWTAGQKPDWDAYVEWVAKWSRHPAYDFAILPDVIDGDENANDTLLAKYGGVIRDGVPVWHMHEPTERLENLIYSWPRVAIGSSGEYAVIGTMKWWGRIAEAMAVACNEDGIPKTRLHGLRQLDPTVTSHIPYASADSTNVARNIGIDSRWDAAAYSITSKKVRAQVLRTRIESHATAKRWTASCGIQMNFELIG